MMVESQRTYLVREANNIRRLQTTSQLIREIDAFIAMADEIKALAQVADGLANMNISA